MSIETDVAEIKTDVKWITGQFKALPCKEHQALLRDHDTDIDNLQIIAARKNGACQAKEKIEQKQTGKNRFNWTAMVSIMAILAAIGIAIFK